MTCAGEVRLFPAGSNVLGSKFQLVFALDATYVRLVLPCTSTSLPERFVARVNGRRLRHFEANGTAVYRRLIVTLIGPTGVRVPLFCWIVNEPSEETEQTGREQEETRTDSLDSQWEELGEAGCVLRENALRALREYLGGSDAGEPASSPRVVLPLVVLWFSLRIPGYTTSEGVVIRCNCTCDEKWAEWQTSFFVGEETTIIDGRGVCATSPAPAHTCQEWTLLLANPSGVFPSFCSPPFPALTLPVLFLTRQDFGKVILGTHGFLSSPAATFCSASPPVFLSAEYDSAEDEQEYSGSSSSESDASSDFDGIDDDLYDDEEDFD